MDPLEASLRLFQGFLLYFILGVASTLGLEIVRLLWRHRSRGKKAQNRSDT